MSITKRVMEIEREKELLRDQMDALIEEGSLSGASEGIAKLLRDKGDLAVLSASQQYVYKQHIAPLLEITCADPECDDELAEDFVADAIRMGRDDALCDHHQYIQTQMEKDD